MRRAAKIDANQHQLVDVLHAIGAEVLSLAALGAGVPDLLVGYRGQNFLLEIKDGAKPPSARILTPEQKSFIQHWTRYGQVAVVKNADEAFEAIGARVRKRNDV